MKDDNNNDNDTVWDASPVHKTQDLGDSLINLSIWPDPIRKPEGFLGKDFGYIDPSQVPFDFTTLKGGSWIENEFGDKLKYWGEPINKYVFVTNDPTRYLSNWFCKWEQVI